MKRIALILIAVCCGGCVRLADRASIPAGYHPQEGDVVFQSLPNPPGLDLVDTIEGATDSPYSHCGMVFQQGGEWKVIEAIGPVKETPLSIWIERGRRHEMWVYRLQAGQRKYVPAALAAMRKDLGKPYDPHYRFDDQAIYCSELIWRGWKTATGHGLGRTVKLGDLNWQPYVSVIESIEGKGNIPLDRKMITPRDLAKAKELRQVFPPKEE